MHWFKPKAIVPFLLLSLCIHMYIFTLNIHMPKVESNVPQIPTVHIVYLETNKDKDIKIFQPESTKIILAKKQEQSNKVFLLRKKVFLKEKITQTKKVSSFPSLDELSKMIVDHAIKQIKFKKNRNVLVDTRYTSGIYTNYVHSWSNKIKRIGETFFSNNEEGHVLLIVKIKNDGTLLHIEIIEESSIKQLNKQALSIVTFSSPFSHFPEAFNVETIRIKTLLTFKTKN